MESIAIRNMFPPLHLTRPEAVVEAHKKRKSPPKRAVGRAVSLQGFAAGAEAGVEGAGAAEVSAASYDPATGVEVAMHEPPRAGA